MSAAFGWTVDEVEQHVVGLIQSGDIQGRVDRQNRVWYFLFTLRMIAHRPSFGYRSVQILQVKRTDYRADLFARAIKAGKDMQSANRKLLLRMRLCVSSYSSLANV